MDEKSPTYAAFTMRDGLTGRGEEGDNEGPHVAREFPVRGVGSEGEGVSTSSLKRIAGCTTMGCERVEFC